MPVIVRTLSAQNQLEISLIENIQRRDLNSIETATSYAKLRDQFNLTNDQIAQRVHKSSSAVINTMRLLKLPKEVIALIAEGKLTEGQARPLIGQDEAVVAAIIEKIITEEWSARKIEQYVVNLKKGLDENPDSKAGTQKNQLEPHQEALITSLKNRLNVKGVDIRTNAKGAGKVTISFKSEEEFKRIQELLG